MGAMGAMGRGWLSVLVTVGCYHPTLQLDVPCTTEGECPSGQTCASDRCVLNGTQSDGAVQLDSPLEGNHLDAAIDAPSDGAPPPVILFKSERDVEVPAAAPVRAVTIPHPACPTGGVMLAVIAFGQSGATAQPAIIAPNGWTLVRRLNHALDATLAVYVHVVAVIEPPQHTWSFTTTIEGVSWIACYANVDTANPIVDANGAVNAGGGPAYPLPSVNPDVPNTMLVGIVVGHGPGSPVTTWTAPAGAIERVDVQNMTTRSGTMTERLDPSTGATAMLDETASQAQDFAILEVLALRPKP